MATITPPTPILEPTPEIVALVRRWREARDRLHAATTGLGPLIEAEQEAWLVLERGWPKSPGWYAIDGRWWAWSKRSKRGLELVVRAELPAGIKARLEQGAKA